MKKYCLLLICLATLTTTLNAKVKLPALISNNMVLQQQTNVKIWGWSDPNATVKVSASWGENKSTKADNEGNWQVMINTPAASFESCTITVSDGEPITVSNILIGEVWLVSGQSNMQMSLMMASGSGPSKDLNEVLAESSLYPGVRFFNVPQNSAIEPQKDTKGVWNVSSPSAASSFSAIGYQYALQLHKFLNVPVGIIGAYWGGTIIEAWMDAESQKSFTDVDLKLLYDEKVPVLVKPICLYNGMIAPLVNYSLRGFLWYQGESNISRYSTYGDKMVAMIKLWRTIWKNDNMPFFYAEIAPFDYGVVHLDTTKAQINAALLREQQNKVMERISNVGMVSTNDLVYPYERNQIHPSNKLGVAKRFTYWALHNTYGFGDVLSPIGPKYKSMEIVGDKAKMSFVDVNGRAVFVRNASSEGDFEGFEVAGSDRVFYPAKVSMGNGNMFSRDFFVFSEKVAKPVAVRYCFKNVLLGNVINVYGMPLIPFRTDDW